MKKLICMILTLSLTLIPLTSVFADEPGDIEKHLVTHWDFEGGTDEVLKDKAPNGRCSDELTMHGDAVKIENGIAHVPSAEGNCFSAAAGSPDLNNVYSMTVYIKAKYAGFNLDFADLIAYDGLYRIYKLKSEKSPLGAVLQATAFATANNADLGTVRIRPESDPSLCIDENEWFIVALTINIDKDNVGTATLYVTKDGVNYSITEKTMTFTNEIFDDMEKRRNNAEAEILLGKLSLVKNIPDRWIEFWYDDVRIYDTALDAEQVTNLMSANIEAPEEPVTDAPATEAPKTEPPATEAPATEAPITEAPVTEAPVTEAPATEAPLTDAPATEAPLTDEPDNASDDEAANTGVYIAAGAAVIIVAAVAAVLLKKKNKGAK